MLYALNCADKPNSVGLRMNAAVEIRARKWSLKNPEVK